MPQCPKCRIPLCRIERQGIPVHTCPECKGTLVEGLRLGALERRADPAWTEVQKDAFCRLADESNDLREVLCPHCSRVMLKNLFRHYANLQVDHCGQCNAWWFDAGEVEKMQILYQEDMAGRTEEDWARIEKQAVAEMAAETRKQELRDWAAGGSAAAPGLGDTDAGALGGSLAGLLPSLGMADRRLADIDADAEATVKGPLPDQTEEADQLSRADRLAPAPPKGLSRAQAVALAIGVLLLAAMLIFLIRSM